MKTSEQTGTETMTTTTDEVTNASIIEGLNARISTLTTALQAIADFTENDQTDYRELLTLAKVVARQTLLNQLPEVDKSDGSCIGKTCTITRHVCGKEN